MLREPQRLSFNDKETIGPCINVYFSDCKQSISLPVEKAIDTALTTLKVGFFVFFMFVCLQLDY